MYENNLAPAFSARRKTLVSRAVAAFALAAAMAGSATAQVPTFQPPSVLRKISGLNEKLELVTNSSRILTLDKPIPRVLVNNPELLAVTPLSATQVQISAKKAGVTQVNLWDEEGNIHTVDVLIYGDARELEVALQTQFPHSSIKVYRYSESLVLTGFVDNPTHVSQIKLLAEDYAPKVITNINVGGVQQVLLKVKIMEVSRTKLQRFAVDFAYLSSNGGFFGTSVSGLISNISLNAGGVQTVTDTGGQTAKFGIVGDSNALFGLLDILEQHQIAKILAEPNLTAVSGRPAQFNVGGEIPIVVPQSLGTASIEYKKFGTQVDFLPIVLGNGNIRLEVRPRVSEIDDTRSVVLQDFVIPALTVREVDTAVEMKAGQTFALAGLVQERSENVNRGLPYVKDIPGIGVPFRKTESEVNEIELLILVTPEFVDPLDPHEAPCMGPGYTTTNPERCDLYCAGHVEVPSYVNPIRGPLACGECGGPSGSCNCGATNGATFSRSQVIIQGGAGYDNGPTAPTMVPGMMQQSTQPPAPMQGAPNGRSMNASPLPSNVPVDLPLPGADAPASSGAGVRRVVPQIANRPAAGTGGLPQRQPVYLRNAPIPNNPQTAAAGPVNPSGGGGLIGPIGYDAQ